jgi:DNA-directed RNA polymerase specialized sigma24 family protein
MEADPADTRDQLARLPERHLAALRAALAGFSDDDIAGLLGIPVEAVPTTVRLAVAKLVTALATRHGAPAGGRGRRIGGAPAAGASEDQ